MSPLSLTDTHRLTVSDIQVRFDAFTLGPVTLDLAGPAIVGLLGSNGSGKTTLLRTILGLQRADRGETRWDGALLGREPSTLGRVGYVTDSADDLIPELTPAEYWDYCALAYARLGKPADLVLDRAAEFAAELELIAPRRSLRSLSLGMRRKSQLIGALMAEPELLILDEPLIGLDFMAIRALERVLLGQRQRGTTIVVASHDMGVTGRIADQIAVLDYGRLILDAPLSSSADRDCVEERVASALRAARGQASPDGGTR